MFVKDLWPIFSTGIQISLKFLSLVEDTVIGYEKVKKQRTPE